jgi:Flp pilus assembly protein TadG
VSVSRLARCTKGTTALEFAWVAPVFIMLSIGAFNLAWSFHCTRSLHFAMVEATRILRLNPATSQSQLQQLVRDDVQIDRKESVTVTLIIDPPSGGTKLAHATVTYPIVMFIPMMGSYSSTYTSTVTVPLPVS